MAVTFQKVGLFKWKKIEQHQGKEFVLCFDLSKYLIQKIKGFR